MIKKQTKHMPFYRKKAFLWPVGIVVGLVIVVALAFRLSPWPGALLIRQVFDQGAHKTLVGLQRDVPPQPVTVLVNQQYAPHNAKAFLDVYMPQTVANTQATLPVVIWTHGGAWLSGDKTQAAPYYRMLSAQGFVVISLNYSLAPEKTYPAAVHELNDAYGYIEANAGRFHADPNTIFFAGDSAGAQLSSQMAAIITNPAYAQEVGVQPTLKAAQLKGVALFCGIYKVEGLTEPSPTLPKIVSWGSDVSVWAYMGTRDKTSPLIRQASTYYHVTKDFPATFIGGGNGDPLTNAQSVPLSTELKSLGAPVTTLFYPADHTPSLPHEYQFNLNADGRNAFTQLVQFLKQRASQTGV